MSAGEKALALLNGLRDAVTNLPARVADPRLAKAFLRVSDCIFELEQWCMESTALEDRALIAACAPYLKDGETPAECIARNRADVDSVLTLLAQAKQAVQHLATCATNGHVYGHTGACIFCGEPKSTPVEPAGASEPPRQHYVDVPPNRRVVGVFSDGSYMIEHGDGQREHVYVRRSAKGYQAGASPVAPEPPTEERQMTHRDTLGNEFGPAPRDPFWSAPTGAPAPCVWRETRDHGLTVYTPICRPECVTDTPLVTEYVVCPHCKAPLTVER